MNADRITGPMSTLRRGSHIKKKVLGEGEQKIRRVGV